MTPFDTSSVTTKAGGPMRESIFLEPRLPEEANALLSDFRSRFASCAGREEQLDVIRSVLRSQTLREFSRAIELTVRLFFELLEDLMLQGWDFAFEDERLIATPPSVALESSEYKDPMDVKRRLRETLIAARNEQLSEPQNRRFIREMERPRMYRGRMVSVQNLLMSPDQLASDLERRLSAPPEIQEALLEGFVEPYLQLVLPGERDRFTNLRLTDIWRYCRYTWSLPLNSQPGRQMLYLIRDASRDFHPIMGIGALASSVIQITCRDDHIGWTIDSLKRNPCAKRLLALEQEILRAIDDVYWSDLLDASEVVAPDDAVLGKLKATIEAHPPVHKALRRSNGDDSSDLLDETLSPLYRRKRATELLALLDAKKTFQSARERYPDPEERLRWLLSTDRGVTALKIALRSIKKRHVGNSILDITTCGAIFPYSELLAGKLVSLLMASPIVVSNYREMYSNAVSEIASKMKGNRVIRPAELVLLGTTSLYHVGSSQYNRLKCPTSNGEIRFIEVGKTDGFGSVHISNRTYRTLQELLRVHPNLKPESSAFAAGVNYKLRSISVGLRYLGLHGLARHRTRRIVYTVPLAANYREYLCGIDESPHYIYDTLRHPEKETDAIIRFWKTRWLVPRLKRPETLRRLKEARSGPVKVSELAGLSRAETKVQQVMDFPVLQVSPRGGSGGERGAMDGSRTLSWRILAGLKDQSESFAERLDIKDVEALHVPTPLDTGILELVQAGKRVYLTGNPGDGKTHLIRRHERLLQEYNVVVVQDASAVDEEETIREIERAIKEGRPAIIAINEGPLRRILRRLPEREQLQVREQLDHPYSYGSEEGENKEYDAIVLNIGLNQYLSRRVITVVFDLLRRFDFSDAPAPIKKNAELVTLPRVRERIQQLLSLVAQMGAHVTMHEVWGFFSYLITGSRVDVDHPEQVLPYYDLCFATENPLHRWLRSLDPARINHPKWDMVLWDGDLQREVKWASFSHDGKSRPRDLREFESLKRRFFFESEQGDDVLKMLPEDQRSYHELLERSRRAADISKVQIIGALSAFFGGPVERGNEDCLHIWTSHKYNAIKPATAYISSCSIPPDKIKLELPAIRKHIATYLIYEPNHVRLRVSFDEPKSEVGFVVDYELWVALMQIKRGLAPRYHNPVISRRIQQFMSRLAAEYQKTRHSGLVRIYIRDLDAARTYSLKVSRTERRYVFS